MISDQSEGLERPYGASLPTSEITPRTRREATAKEVAGKLYIHVPWSDKEEADKMGVRWDPAKRMSYIPEGIDLAPYRKWMEPPKPMSHADLQADFLTVCDAMGLVLPGNGLPVMDGSWQKTTVSTSSKTNALIGSYRAAILADGTAHGYVHNHDLGEGQGWKSSAGRVSEVDLEAHRKLAEENRSAREVELNAKREEVAKQSAKNWASSSLDVSSAYLDRKQVESFGLRQRGDLLVIPLSDLDGKIWSLQHINPEGRKLNTTDGKKNGNFFVLGNLSEGKTILYGEGYATCASLRLGTGLPVIMVVDGSNIGPVVKQLVERFPEKQHIICGDDDVLSMEKIHGSINKRIVSDFASPKLLLPKIDMEELNFDGVTRKLHANSDCEMKLQYTHSSEGIPRIIGQIHNAQTGKSVQISFSNGGREHATAAAVAHNVKLVFPIFQTHHEGMKDFNDLYVLEGKSAVRKQIGKAMVGHLQLTADDSKSEGQRVLKKGISLTAVEDNHRYAGEIIARSASAIFQDIGRQQAVEHKLHKLTTIPNVGDVVRIEYRKGMGEIKKKMDRTTGLEH